MSVSNRDRVGRALDLLNDGLKPFVVREMEATYGTRWKYQASDSLRDQHFTDDGQDFHLDIQALFLIMWDQSNQVFKKTLGHAERKRPPHNMLYAIGESKLAHVERPNGLQTP